jgi:hypothetical protein
MVCTWCLVTAAPDAPAGTTNSFADVEFRDITSVGLLQQRSSKV